MSNRPILPAVRVWWGMLLLIIVLTGALYFTGYQISLPYVDHPDEPSFNLAAQMIIDSGTAKPMGYNAYPPGIISVNYLVLKALNSGIRYPASQFIPVVRLITVTIGLLTVVVVAFLGYEIAGPLAGLLAAVIWAVNPIWNAHVRFATADSYITFFALLALWLVCVGTTRDREPLITAATYVLMLGIIFKTQAIFLLPLIFMLPLIRWWRSSESAYRKRILWAWFWNGVRWALFMFWLLALYPTLDANKIVQWVAPTDKLSIPSPQLLIAHLNITLLATRPLIVWVLMIVILIIAIWSGKNLLSRVSLAATIMALGLFLFGISLFGLQSNRQMYFLLALGDLLTGVTLAVIANSIIMWLASRNRQTKTTTFLPVSSIEQRRGLIYSAVIIYAVVAITPALSASVATAQDALKPDSRNQLAAYMDTSLAPAPLIANTDNHKTLNRDYGGYQGHNNFPLVAVADLTSKPLEEWRDQNATYAIVNYGTDLQSYAPNQLLLLKSFSPNPNYRGPSMQVYRLHPIQTRLNQPVQIGSVKLIGYDLSTVQPAAGSDITVTFYWQADAPTHVPMRVFTHLYPPDQVEIIAQQDGLPLPDDLERRPTSMWDDPDEVFVSRPFTLTIPAETAPGNYRLVQGFYDPNGTGRLSTATGETFIPVTEIEVLPP